ncbi:MAG TPA: BON domain-containing protein [Candidatus Angelobacter sp.]|nr:BON domain-containing protein [Candidatus Angelobacter sp.]
MNVLTRIGTQTLVLAGLALPGAIALAQGGAPEPAPPAQNQTAPAPDNTKSNQGDQNANATTADRQKDNPSDRDVSQQIRQAIMQDKSLSTYAHNVKIISQNGTVTLKGPVRSEDEKQAIEAKANEVAGNGAKVINDLTVAPKK